MIVLTLILFAALHAHPAARKVPEHRQEVCPGALYFIKHGEHAPWTKGNKVLCHIGGHDFYGALGVQHRGGRFKHVAHKTPVGSVGAHAPAHNVK